ncbi:unnamed protein product [Amoebophrya sp. A120]|nr:unnamed protein product [Amoebophrya sp. A120]|eukprot:GSA120T00015078001.1
MTSLYAVLRNSLWEGPATANTNPVYNSFRVFCEQCGYETTRPAPATSTGPRSTSEELAASVEQEKTTNSKQAQTAPAGRDLQLVGRRTGNDAELVAEEGAQNKTSSRSGFPANENTVATFLTWKFSFMCAGLLFGLVQLGLTYKTEEDVIGEYKGYLAQFPDAVQAHGSLVSVFDSFLDVLYAYEASMWGIAAFSYGLLLVAAVLLRLAVVSSSSESSEADVGGAVVAAQGVLNENANVEEAGVVKSPPATAKNITLVKIMPEEKKLSALKKIQLSSRLMLLAWFLGFAPPFFVIIIFPVRMLLDWTDVRSSLCQDAITRTLALPGVGTQLQEQLAVLEQTSDMGSFVTTTAAAPASASAVGTAGASGTGTSVGLSAASGSVGSKASAKAAALLGTSSGTAGSSGTSTASSSSTPVGTTSSASSSSDTTITVNGNAIKQWCAAQGEDWITEFFEKLDHCTRLAETNCRTTTCGNAAVATSPSAGALTSSFSRLELACLTNCVQFVAAPTNSTIFGENLDGSPVLAALRTTQKASYKQDLATCLAAANPPTSASSGAGGGSGATSTSGTTSATSSSSSLTTLQLPALASTTRRQPASYGSLSDLTTEQQHVKGLYLKDLQAKAETAMLQADHVIGLMVGLIFGRQLQTSAMALVGGIAAALLSVKAFFPDDKHSLVLLLVTTLEAIPLYMALLGIFNQMLVGGSSTASSSSSSSQSLDYCFTIACVSLVLYEGATATTGVRSWRANTGGKLNLREKRDEMGGFLQKQYILYAVLFLVLAVALYLWANQEGKATEEYGATDYAIEYMLDFEMIVSMTISYYAKKCVTAVATTDLFLSAFVEADHAAADAMGMHAASKQGGGPRSDPSRGNDRIFPAGADDTSASSTAVDEEHAKFTYRKETRKNFRSLFLLEDRKTA